MKYYDYVPHSNILMSVKREFSRSIIVDQKFQSRRVEIPRIKKDGSEAKVPNVCYVCEHCEGLFKQIELQCDHKIPVVPVEIPTKHMPWEMMIERSFVKTLDQLQLLCKPCHKVKTQEENKLRKEWRQKEKYMVIITYNALTWKSYIDVHVSADINDGYLGSDPQLLKEVEQLGTDKFVRKVMFCYDNATDAANKLRELRGSKGNNEK